MSTSIFPTLKGIGWEVKRTPVWSTDVQRAVSGKEVRVSYWTYPTYQWELKYDFLRSDTTNLELQTLIGFFNARQGMFDSFLYQDSDDFSVTAQGIGLGDGVTTTFQLVRAFGGYVEPIFAPLAVSNVYVAGLTVNPGQYSVSNYSSSTPGIITFSTAPTGTVSADFTYYFPCRFMNDNVTFNNFMIDLWRGEKVAFVSVK